MKEKILNALKNEYKTLGLGDKAFNGVASFIEKTITDEKDIVNRIKEDDVKDLLKSIQGESDALRNARIQAEKSFEEYKKLHSETGEVNPSVPTPSDELAKTIKEMQEKQAALEQRYAESEAKNRRNELTKDVRGILKGSNRGVDRLLDLVLEKMEIADGDTAQSLADKYKDVYDSEYRNFYGNGAVPPIGGSVTPEPYKKGQFSGVVSGLQELGVLPKDN